MVVPAGAITPSPVRQRNSVFSPFKIPSTLSPKSSLEAITEVPVEPAQKSNEGKEDKEEKDGNEEKAKEEEKVRKAKQEEAEEQAIRAVLEKLDEEDRMAQEEYMHMVSCPIHLLRQL